MATNINYGKLFSTEIEDRVDDVYLLTMKEMDDKTLQAYCSINRFNVGLCNNEVFWLDRIRKTGLTALLSYRSMYNNLREFYFNVRRDAYYLVTGDIVVTNVFSNIQSAYNYLHRAILGEFDKIILQPDDDSVETIIAIIFKNTTVDDLNPYVLFSLDRQHPKYLADISVYPQLNPDKFVLYKEISGGPNTAKQVIIASFDDNGLRYFRQIVGNNDDNTEDYSNTRNVFLTLTVDNDRENPEDLNSLWISLPLGIVTIAKKKRIPKRYHELVLIDLFEPRKPTRVDLQGLSGYVLIKLGMKDWFEIRESAGVRTEKMITDDNEYLRSLILDRGTIYPLSELPRLIVSLTQ